MFSERKVPPASPLASTIAYRTSGFWGEIANPMRPLSPEGRPRLISRHEFPPSVDLWIPEPGPPSIIVHWWRRRCHEVAYITSGFRGSK